MWLLNSSGKANSRVSNHDYFEKKMGERGDCLFTQQGLSKWSFIIYEE